MNINKLERVLVAMMAVRLVVVEASTIERLASLSRSLAHASTRSCDNAISLKVGRYAALGRLLWRRNDGLRNSRAPEDGRGGCAGEEESHAHVCVVALSAW